MFGTIFFFGKAKRRAHNNTLIIQLLIQKQGTPNNDNPAFNGQEHAVVVGIAVVELLPPPFGDKKTSWTCDSMVSLTHVGLSLGSFERETKQVAVR